MCRAKNRRSALPHASFLFPACFSSFLLSFLLFRFPLLRNSIEYHEPCHETLAAVSHASPALLLSCPVLSSCLALSSCLSVCAGWLTSHQCPPPCLTPPHPLHNCCSLANVILGGYGTSTGVAAKVEGTHTVRGGSREGTSLPASGSRRPQHTWYPPQHT